MSLFKIQQTKTVKLQTSQVLERQVQTLIENNLETVLDIYFLQTEYSTTYGGRIDTLGIDKTGSPVIIEYKRGSNDSVINQALSYLKWLLDHKAEFEKLVEKANIEKNIEIDWDSPRVICIAESYNKFDIDTVDILPINIELLRYRIYENDILYLDPENYQKVRVSTSGIIKRANADKERQVEFPKNYSIDDHINKADEETKQTFLSLREKITSLDEDVIEEPKAKYIAYKTSTNFVDVTILHNSIKIFLNVTSGQLKDPDNIARDLTKPRPVGHWGNGDYEIKIDKNSDLEKIFELIKQSYSLNI